MNLHIQNIFYLKNILLCKNYFSSKVTILLKIFKNIWTWCHFYHKIDSKICLSLSSYHVIPPWISMLKEFLIWKVCENNLRNVKKGHVLVCILLYLICSIEHKKITVTNNKCENKAILKIFITKFYLIN